MIETYLFINWETGIGAGFIASLMLCVGMSMVVTMVVAMAIPVVVF